MLRLPRRVRGEGGVIQEIALIPVKPGCEAAFEAAVTAAGPIFADARGCVSAVLQRVIEAPGTYRLLVEWETLENHTVDFPASESFKAWRATVGAFFAHLPTFDHGEEVVEIFRRGTADVSPA